MMYKDRKVTDLITLNNNPRTISKDSFAKLKQSIQDNPDYFKARPLILSDRTGDLVIIAGNQRYRVALELGLKTVPTFLLTGLDEQREKEIIIRDNVNNGDWDYEVLANEFDIDDLINWDVNLPVDFREIEPVEDDINIVDEVQEFKLMIETENKILFDEIKSKLDQLNINYKEV